MRQFTSLILLAVLVSQGLTAPQFISFNDGKLGVNFGGYHAAVGLGGAAGGSAAGGGLFAEAGTPYGPAARAGLGGAVDGNGGSAGGLYAGATAGGNVKANAGLSGGVTAEKSAGVGYASAQAGDRFAASGLGGESSIEGKSGFSFSGSNSFGFAKNVEIQPVVKTVEVQPVIKTVEVQPVFETVKTVKVQPVKTVATPVYKEVVNEISVAPVQTEAKINFHAEVAPPTVVKEVYVEPPPATVVHKEYVRYKPHRHHFRKTAYIGGYVGSPFDFIPPPPPPPPAPVVVYKTRPAIYKTVHVQPALEKRIDVGVESGVNAGAVAQADYGVGGGGHIGYTKQVTVQRNPTFFADIFNIPISTLRAVGNFLGNAAGGTNISVQKSASLHTDSDTEPSKHAPSSSISSTTSEAHVSVQTPPVSKFIDDIFSIPINTLGAVNKFLENNVPARKNVQVTDADGTISGPTKVRLGHKARRRANKQKVVIVESPEHEEISE